MCRFVVGLLLFVSVTAAQAQDTRLGSYPLPDHGTLQLTVPGAWKDELRQPPNRLPPTIAFTPNTGAPFEAMVTALWPPTKDVPRITAAGIRGEVERAVDGAKAQAAEKTIEVKELRGTSGVGYYFSVTDRAPGPGEFKYMTQGMIGVGDLLLTFTVLTNDTQASIVADVLAMMGNAHHVIQ